jgi:hypothetical protein
MTFYLFIFFSSALNGSNAASSCDADVMWGPCWTLRICGGARPLSACGLFSTCEFGKHPHQIWDMSFRYLRSLSGGFSFVWHPNALGKFFFFIYFD